jgi:hypothetical protein
MLITWLHVVINSPPIACLTFQKQTLASTPQIEVQEVEHHPEGISVFFHGQGVEEAYHVCQATRGGQVVLTGTAWEDVKPVLTQHPGAAQIISLGTHLIRGIPHTTPWLLMEVMPNLLARRNFSTPASRMRIQPGYRDAPDKSAPMAIVFAKVNKPKELSKYEAGEGSAEEAKAALIAFQVSGVGRTRIMGQSA